jgi:tetratricopeptide (TPR) repeat protein
VRRALILLFALVTSTASASPTDELDHARTDFRAHDYESAMKRLSALLYPTEQLALRSDLLEARQMLGACDFEVGRAEEAKGEFEKALQIDPNAHLDPNFFTSGAQHLFDETRSDLEVQRAKEAEVRKLQEERERLQRIRESLVAVEVHHYGYNFLPFGLGQFQNGEQTKGYLFAAGQGVALSGSVGIWLYLASKYGLNCPHCVALPDADNVRLMQEFEVGLGLAAIGLYGWSVIDAVRHYKAQVRVDDSQLPPDLLRDLDKNPRKKQPTSFLQRIHFGPMATPNGVGIGLGWEN